MPAFEDDGLVDSPKHREDSPSTDDLISAVNAPSPRNRPMSEIVAEAEALKRSHMADVGTRYQHMSDLLVQWEDAADMMGKRKFLGRDEVFKLRGIELSIAQLKRTMMSMQGYGDFTIDVRKILNQIPRSSAVFGGRGAALDVPYVPGTEDIT